MSLLKRLNQYFLAKFDESNFINFKRAQFLTNLFYFYLFLLFAMSIACLSMGIDRFLEMVSITVPGMLIGIMALVMIRKGRVTASASLISFFGCIIVVVGFFSKPPHMAGVSLGYFMYLDLVIATMFCSTLLSGAITGIFVGSHITYFIFISQPTAEGLFRETARTQLIDGIATIILVYIVGAISVRFLNTAIQRSEDESARNREQLEKIRALNAAISKTSSKLNSSINITAGAVNNFTESAQKQAASIEELSATIEEVSSGTENVVTLSRDQIGSLADMIKSFEEMSEMIEKVEVYGKRISDIFLKFMEMAEEGKKSSSMLDSINNTIKLNSGEILSVINVMEEFFDRINLLSLNASIEAARAGENGRGFAVVAEEIGKLSDNSANELQQVSGMIQKNRHDVEHGNEVINNILLFIDAMLRGINDLQNETTGALKIVNDQDSLRLTMNRMTSVVREKSDLIEQSMHEQKRAIDDIVESIEMTSTIVQENARTTESLSHNADELKSLSDDLSSGLDGSIA